MHVWQHAVFINEIHYDNVGGDVGVSVELTGTAAAGMTSTGIGATESGATPVGDSLQLQGSGRDFIDYSRGAASNSFEGINMRQSFVAPLGQAVASVPEPASRILLLFAVLLLAFKRGAKNDTAVALPA